MGVVSEEKTKCECFGCRLERRLNKIKELKHANLSSHSNNLLPQSNLNTEGTLGTPPDNEGMSRPWEIQPDVD